MPLGIDSALFDLLIADPASPVEGQVWYNSTAHRLRVRTNTATLDFGGAGGPDGAIQVNQGGSLFGYADFLWNDTTKTLSMPDYSFINWPTQGAQQLGAGPGVNDLTLQSVGGASGYGNLFLTADGDILLTSNHGGISTQDGGNDTYFSSLSGITFYAPTVQYGTGTGGQPRLYLPTSDVSYVQTNGQQFVLGSTGSPYTDPVVPYDGSFLLFNGNDFELAADTRTGIHSVTDLVGGKTYVSVGQNDYNAGLGPPAFGGAFVGICSPNGWLGFFNQDPKRISPSPNQYSQQKV